jgi:hypothetical protein
MAGAGLRGVKEGFDGGGELRHKGGISRWRAEQRGQLGMANGGGGTAGLRWREERDRVDGRGLHVSERGERR